MIYTDVKVDKEHHQKKAVEKGGRFVVLFRSQAIGIGHENSDFGVAILTAKEKTSTEKGGGLMARINRDPQRELYEALVRKEAELRATLYSIGDGVISVNRNGQVVMMNPAAEKMTGWSEKEARGKPLEEVFDIIVSLG